MSAANKALARRFFEEADRGRTPVELCAPGFTAQFSGPQPWIWRASTSSKR
jgi:hypothetical protein